MRTKKFFGYFAGIDASPERLDASEVKFTVKGVEMRIDRIHVEIGSPLTWTIELGNDPETEGRVLTAEEAEAAFRSRTIEEGE